MKIAIVGGDDFVGDDAGRLCAALAAQGQHACTYVRRSDRASDRRPGEVGADRRYRAVGLPVGPASVAKDADLLPFVGEWAAELERLWSADRPDIVHAYGWLGGLAAQLAARRQDLPTVQTFGPLVSFPQSARSGGGKRKVTRVTERERIEPLLARNANWVTVESSADVSALARLRRSRARVSVLASGVDVEQYTSVGPVLGRTNLHRVLCMASNPLPDNGFDIVIGVMPRVPGTELVVAETDATDRAADRNHTKARNRLKRLAAELGVADRVHFVGTVSGDELPMMVRSADVLVCTPRQPPRATSALAAMASGVAVVALPVGALIDVVVDSVTGLMLDHPNELAAVLRNLLAHDFQCRSMGAAGRSRVESRFTWDRVALDALNIYRQLGADYAPMRSLQPTGTP
ncbi:glycosyl transferase family 1 [Mycobacterium sp. IS-2888]|uniref:glycosyltransferase n=1 Tax=Mycobacterium sp. IS-2888 TaxID=1834159 RepID=UPI00096F7580|nr:glycosyltransferase [Mycobacterium sp. IS-2888]OMC48173.1 glycosyl transferase family 1 [Mycobacterium sp. IS-2888]